MNVNVGINPVSWGVLLPSSPDQTPWNRYLDEVVEAGYEWTELGPYGYLPSDENTLRGELHQRGLKLEAGFTFGDLSGGSQWSKLEIDTLKAGGLAASLGAKYHFLVDLPYTDLRTGERRAPRRLDEDGWKKFIDNCDHIATLIRDRCGLTALLHPHAETHVEYQDQIEQFLEDTDPSVVSMCLDTGDLAWRRVDPIALMQKHYERIPYLHIKNVDPDVRDKVERENVPYVEALSMGLYCEPSHGVIDFPALVEVLRKVDYEGFVVVEQRMYPAPVNKPPVIAKHTREYLREIGMG